MILGIIPSAGKATRFNGVFKELLPLPDGTTLLERTINSMIRGEADSICIVSSPEKISTHISYLDRSKIYNKIHTFFVIQVESKGLGDAISLVAPLFGDLNLFAMPDTYYPTDCFERSIDSGLATGLFQTSSPEKFGVFDPSKSIFVDKPKTLKGIYSAWGTLMWTKDIRLVSDFTDLININASSAYVMDYYFDLAGIEDYIHFLKEPKIERTSTNKALQI